MITSKSTTITQLYLIFTRTTPKNSHVQDTIRINELCDDNLYRPRKLRKPDDQLTLS